MTKYNQAFYDDQEQMSYLSAKEILPIVFEYIKPKSILDVGCGMGTWLNACNDFGVSEIFGVDGSYVNKERLHINADCFLAADLREKLNLKRTFDMVISMEVAEHIDLANAEQFVLNLTSHADVVLFSAAIPYQGGTGHLNENWPEFWALLFEKQGYETIDIVRPRIWNNGNIAFWYRQNTILYVKSDKVVDFELPIRNELSMPLSVIHPDMFLWGCMRDERQPKLNYNRDRQYHGALHNSLVYKQNTPQFLAYGKEYNIDFSKTRSLLSLIKKWLAQNE